MGPQSSAGVPSGHVAAPHHHLVAGCSGASSSRAGADAHPLPHTVIHQLTPAPGSAAPPPRTRISSPAPAPRETLAVLGGSVQVGEKGIGAGGPRRGTVAAQSPVPRPLRPTDSAAGAHPRAFCSALQEQERGGRGTPAVMGACGAGGGHESVVLAPVPHTPTPVPRTFKASVSPSWPQAKGFHLLDPGNRLIDPVGCMPIWTA